MASKKNINKRYFHTFIGFVLLSLLSIYVFNMPIPKPATLKPHPLIVSENPLLLKEIYASGTFLRDSFHMVQYPEIGWYINATPINTESLARYLEALYKIIPSSSFTIRPEEPTFGFENPYLTISLIFWGESSKILIIGDKTPSTNARYAKLLHSSKIYIVPEQTLQNLLIDFTMMADRNFSTLTPEAIIEFSLIRNGGAFAFKKRQNRWYIESPIKAEADSNFVKMFLNRVCGHNADLVIKQDAWDMPYFTEKSAILHLKDSRGRKSMVTFSKIYQEIGFAYVKSDRRPNVFVVQEPVLEALSFSLDDATK